MNDKDTKKEGMNPYVLDRVSRAVSILKMDQSLEALKEALALLTEIEDEKRDKRTNKLMAEINYLTAVEYKEQGKLQEMHQYAKISIDLYRKCTITTLEDSVPILSKSLPDYMHEGVVESRLLREE